ncbi:SigE family RNA polymerase sigma factor [Nonomuraea sp. NN258]|uniref:SigE family RNA polymerase sigma factor n=1 Tax=Nonomuraea antri TaxID=2730852 RepID=UPI001567F89C|nr:SigE family RNA polymerase sigma factor [Nonomuraea antri]NRQ33643.1 SigE family RNA polymerase sigma factor [Nonomuraea antri]
MDRNDSFREFVAAHQQSLMRTAYLLTGDAHLAEDLLQSVLLKVLGRWPRLSHVDNPRAYARRALVNQHISWRRRLTWHESPVAARPEREPSCSSEDATVVRLAVRQALARLPPRQRAVIVLRFYEDLTEHETAKAMNCSIGTVKSQTHHALARLRMLAPELAPRFAEMEDPREARR